MARKILEGPAVATVINSASLRMVPAPDAFVKACFYSGKPGAPIWTIIEAGAARGRRRASWSSLKTDLQKAGVGWVNEEAVVDRRLLTGHNPDIPAFNKVVIKRFASARARSRQAAAK